MRHAGKIGLFLVGAVAAAVAVAQETPQLEEAPDVWEPLFVNYGKSASIRQGDNDHRQAIYLSVPAATTDKLYVRIFDGDTNNSTSLYDQIDRRQAVTRTRFTVFGGDGASIAGPTDIDALAEQELSSGTKLAEQVFSRERRYDNTWTTIAELDPAQGALVGDRRVFRVLVDALSGVNGNVYDVTVSTRPEENVKPAGLEMFAYTATVRMPRRGVLTELRFRVPEEAYFIRLGNFDAAFGTAFYTTQVLSTPLTASGQGNWEESTLLVQARDRGEMAAITLSGGNEYPNDATFYVSDLAGILIPFELPPEVFVINERPNAVASSDDMETCMTVAFDGTASSDPEGAPLSYLWRFDDGATAEGPSAVHEYTDEGRFFAKLEVVDHSPQLGNGATVNVPVFVKNPPEALSGKRALVAAGEDNTYDGTPSTGRAWAIARHQWDFGDGTSVEGEKVVHAYAEPGVYTVTHRVTDASGHRCNTASETFEVRVNAEPVAEAGADRRISVGEETVLDAGASTDSDGTIVDYQWDFGDGATASGAVVRHAYASPATYRIKLAVADDSAVANSGDEDSLTIVVNDPPVPEAGEDRSVAIAEPLAFSGGASIDRDGDIIAYDWDFGDGNSGSGHDVTHAYEKSGTYSVTLRVTDDSTTDTASVDDTLSVRVNEPPVASAGPDQLVTASLVTFDGSRSSDLDDSISRHEWDFGDGNSGAGAEPSHVYAKPGTYDVTLTVTDASGTIRNTAQDTMQVVVNARPIADAGPDLIGAPGEKLVLQANRSLDPDGEIADYQWDFRDGSKASGRIVEHAFDKPGSYAVRLTVRDDTGQEQAVDHAETLVVINTPPVAEAGADIAAIAGDEVRLSAAGSFDPDGEIVNYRWDFSDSDEPVEGAEIDRTFAAPGVYSAQLTVTDDSGAANGLATDTVEIAINHAPVADAGPNIVTDQSTITFDGTRSLDADGDALTYRWDFGDGGQATGPIAAHSYAAGGTYPVLLTVDDGTGLANATDETAISVTINRPPVAVAGENRQVCSGDTILLDGSNSTDPDGGVLRYAWDFGDGTTSDIINPTKSYSIGGTYPITLTVTDDSGLGNGSNSSQMAVVVDQGPVARAGEDIVACAKTEVEFDGSGSTDVDGVVNSFAWDFGDGGFGGGERPRHIFNEPGTYRVFLTIEGEKVGICDSTSTDEIEARIVEGPVAVIDALAAAPITDAVTFDGSASSMADGNIVDWRWDFGDGQTANGATVEHRYAEAGTYQVSLTLTSDSPSPSCQKVSIRHVITVNAPPVADAGTDQQVAVGEEAVFDASASADPDGGLTAYQWDFGDGATASGIEVRHRYRTPGTYTAMLTVRDGADLANSTARDELVVVVNPAPEPAIAGPEVACVGETVAWQADISAGDADADADNVGKKADADADNVGRFVWYFGDGASANSPRASHAYGKAGWYSLTLAADDGRGLSNSRQLSARTIHVNRPPHPAAGPDQATCPGDTVRFDGAASADPDGLITRQHWDFGDGASAEGATVDHVFAEPGTYTVTLTVTDDAGSGCSSTSDTLEVFVNAPPVADAGADRDVWIGGANDAVLLDGSASHDPDGQALTHTWQIGNGGSAFGERVRHTLTELGDTPVTLTVSDTSGLACGTASSTVHLTAKQRN
jgi:PKD repeat protein